METTSDFPPSQVLSHVGTAPRSEAERADASTLTNNFMCKQISPAELAKGQNVTVLQWVPWDAEVQEDGFLGGTKTITRQDHSWCGDVLHVEAVQLPYVIVSHPNEKSLYGDRPTRLDTRRAVLMELSAEYVAASKRGET